MGERIPTYRIDRLPAPPDTWCTYRKASVTPAIRLRGPFRCVTSEGNTAECADGWLALDAHGHPYPINDAEFEAIYEPDDGDQAPTLLHLLASLYDATECLAGDEGWSCDMDDPDDRCIVCRVGDYLAKAARGGATDG